MRNLKIKLFAVAMVLGAGIGFYSARPNQALAVPCCSSCDGVYSRCIASCNGSATCESGCDTKYGNCLVTCSPSC